MVNQRDYWGYIPRLSDYAHEKVSAKHHPSMADGSEVVLLESYLPLTFLFQYYSLPLLKCQEPWFSEAVAAELSDDQGSGEHSTSQYEKSL